MHESNAMRSDSKECVGFASADSPRMGFGAWGCLRRFTTGEPAAQHHLRSGESAVTNYSSTLRALVLLCRKLVKYAG